jgi:hypothetical protein
MIKCEACNVGRDEKCFTGIEPDLYVASVTLMFHGKSGHITITHARGHHLSRDCEVRSHCSFTIKHSTIIIAFIQFLLLFF